MKTCRVGWMLAVVLALGTSVRGQALIESIPGDAIAYVGWTGASAMPPEFAQSNLKAMLEASDVQKLFADALPKLMEKAGEHKADVAQVSQILGPIMAEMWDSPAALYVAAPTKEGKEPKLAVICKAGEKSKGLAERIEKAVAKAAESDKAPPMKVHRADDRVVITVGIEDEAVLARLGAKKGAAAAGLADTAGFKRAAGQVQKNAVVCAYVNVQGLMDAVGKFAPMDASQRKMLPKMMEVTGLGGLKQVIMTWGFEGKDWSNMVFIDAPAPRSGLFKLLDGGQVSDESLAVAPKSSAMVACMRLDLSKLAPQLREIIGEVAPDKAGEFDKGMEEFKKQVGIDLQKDLLSSFGDQWVMYADRGIGGTGVLGMTVVNELRDAKKAEEALTKLGDVLVGMAGEKVGKRVHLSTKVTKVGGQTIHYLPLPLVSPSWAIKDGRLYVALYPQVVSAAAERGARADDSILKSDAFVKFRQRMGGTKAGAMWYMDLPQTADSTYPMAIALMQTFTGAINMMGAVEGVDFPPMLLPPMSKLLPLLSPAGGVFTMDDAGWHVKSIEPFPGSSLLTSQAGLVQMIPSVAVQMLVPALGKAKQRAQMMQSGTQMRGIVQASVIWAEDNNSKLPPDLATVAEDAAVPPRMFIHPDAGITVPADFEKWEKDKRRAWVEANSSYVYLGKGKSNDTDATVIVLYEQPRFARRGTINVGFADCHVEAMPIEAAMKAVSEQESGRANDPAPAP